MPLKFANNQSLTGTTALPSAVPTDNLILISTQTASNSASLSFTSGLDSTYDMYEFKFINIRPANDNNRLMFNLSTDSGSNYNVTKTTTFFRTYHNESGTEAGIDYITSDDLAQSTSDQPLTHNGTIGNDADQSGSGYMQLFNPSSTTYVKHFIANTSAVHASDYEINSYVAGYGNTTSAINAIIFRMASGNIADGIIKMYGVKKS
jgi:hypothetical protein